ncbi:MAG TPA: neutral/alkaline non-lysosomal ceramidase N-terminal domain-containing protein, partial [Tepidisphaeraceae bacterium]|nr:neutral/alkaline non-lysosomal ceramidase N-terminal domain-containing protein [Tepidisphaeraceae bacterium]
MSESKRKSPVLMAGAAKVDISPTKSMFLSGYPHVKRYSTGTHDPLLSSALFLDADGQRVLFIANDIIYVSKQMVQRARQRIAKSLPIPEANILISASHTHSGPKMLDPLATEADEAVPKTDESYVQFVEDRIVEAAIKAHQNLTPAVIGLAVADATGVGTNRRDPNGPKDLQVPVLVVRENAKGTKPIAAMLVCSMHPTVLHEDSTLVSGDFPGLARQYLQKTLLGEECVVLYHTGPAGNQSPRHVTKANTFAEAERLGTILGEAAAKVIPSIEYASEVTIDVRTGQIELPLRQFASEVDAQMKLDTAVERLQKLRGENAPRVQIRTAETDWFGAQETLTIARAAQGPRLNDVARTCMPAEIQVIRIGPWKFVGWQGEMFIEFALEVKAKSPNTFLISYANGELQGYLVTKQAVEEGGYESGNAIFKSPEGGELIVAKTLELLN